MAARRAKRIINEIKELETSADVLKQNGVYFHYNDDDINMVYALLIGPKDTPYENGFYFFKFEYPENYPMTPPKATYCTQGLLKHALSDSSYKVRFNPNLYTCGKVCLSMLNTWAGPGWVPTNTISNVLIAIQALVLNEYPLQNEPGFEDKPKQELAKYNQIIEYANIKISVIEMITNTPVEFVFFKDTISKYFIENIDYYRNFVLTKNDLLKDNLIESPAYGMKYKMDYPKLLDKILQTEEYIINNIVSSEMDNISVNSHP
jgi:ubiquitin-conjugating enzyme E2 Z